MSELARGSAIVIAEYKKRLRAFKRDMKKLGVKVKVTATINCGTSIVEVDEE